MPRKSQIPVALLALLVFALLSGCGGGNGDEDDHPGQPRIVTAEQLSEFAAKQDQPVYWVGPRKKVSYELTETDGGRIFVRYLAAGEPAGDPRPRYLTVGTYPSPHAAAALTRLARSRNGVDLARTDDGAVLLVGAGSTNRAHLAYPGDEVQVEVFSPAQGEALRLASQGAVRPVPRRG